MEKNSLITFYSKRILEKDKVPFANTVKRIHFLLKEIECKTSDDKASVFRLKEELQEIECSYSKSIEGKILRLNQKINRIPFLIQLKVFSSKETEIK